MFMPRPRLEPPTTPPMILISLSRDIIRISLSILIALPFNDRDVFEGRVNGTRDESTVVGCSGGEEEEGGGAERSTSALEEEEGRRGRGRGGFDGEERKEEARETRGGGGHP